MDIKNLAKEIIEGKRLIREDDLSIFISCDLKELCEAADLIREHFVGDDVDLCAIINGRSGRCPEDCKYCAQSAHYDTDCAVYDFIEEEALMEACALHDREGVHRFSIVTAGKNLSGEEFEKAVSAYKKMQESYNIHLCASFGFLSKEQLQKLKEVGVTRYHHNIETSKRFFPEICSTHSFDDKINTIKMIQDVGLEVCSGVIVGMGETWEDRIDMALSLSELSVDSIPINALMPIKGTPLENRERLSEDELLRIIAIFRFLNPKSGIRLAAGRALMSEDGKAAFRSGASATITGNMLTTAACATIERDMEMLREMGRGV